MENSADISRRLFIEQPCNCAQAVLAVFAERFGLPRETALHLAAPFGGGTGRSGAGACGAVTGALLALGLAAGRLGRPAAETNELAYRLAGDFLARFQHAHGAWHCRPLLNLDIGTAEGWAEAKAKGLFHTLCPGFVETAATLVEEILVELGPPGPQTM